jgi:hypothetical protein
MVMCGTWHDRGINSARTFEIVGGGTSPPGAETPYKGGEDVKVYPLTSGQPPSFSGRNASAAGIVARSL